MVYISIIYWGDGRYMIHVVYFNQFFSSIRPVIADLKLKLGNSIKVIASSRNPMHVYKDVVDEFIVEDWEKTGENYISWLDRLIGDYHIDLMFCKSHLDEIANAYTKLNHKYGVKICMDDIAIKSYLHSKCNTYTQLSINPELVNFIPWHLLVTTNKVVIMDGELNKYIKYYSQFVSDIFSREFRREHNIPNKLCMKFDTGEGGTSFRNIDDSPITASSLNKIRFNTITSSEAESILEDIADSPQDLLIMEYLDGPEISVDCYNSHSGFIAVAREKNSGTRVQKIYCNPDLTNICYKIANTLELDNIFNVQFRVKAGYSKNDINNLRILEINPRLSGGAYQELLAGINLVEAQVKDYLGIKGSYKTKVSETNVTYVEQAIIVGK